MKAPPKRKGNNGFGLRVDGHVSTLNESPSEKEGKCIDCAGAVFVGALNESPSEKEGKLDTEPLNC